MKFLLSGVSVAFLRFRILFNVPRQNLIADRQDAGYSQGMPTLTLPKESVAGANGDRESEPTMSDDAISDQLQQLLDRLRAGDSAVLQDLYHLVNDRLTVLTRKMKRGQFARIQGWEQTEDLAQNAKIRLIRTLAKQPPATAREFYALANLQIRRELLDTIRQHTGRDGQREPFLGMTDVEQADETPTDPEELALWREFHQYVDRLPAEERELVELLWYQGLTQEQAARLLHVDPSTVKRRWREIRPKLAAILPEMD
jgi:RNA polymerase sigma-70 factor (ECF subfamily)